MQIEFRLFLFIRPVSFPRQGLRQDAEDRSGRPTQGVNGQLVAATFSRVTARNDEYAETLYPSGRRGGDNHPSGIGGNPAPPDRAYAPRPLRNIRGDRYRRPPGPRLLPSSRPNPGPPTVPRPIYEDGTREFRIRPGGRGREMYMFTGRCRRCNRRRVR